MLDHSLFSVCRRLNEMITMVIKATKMKKKCKNYGEKKITIFMRF